MDKPNPLLAIIRLLGRNKPVLAHGRRVARISCAIAKEMKYGDNKISLVRISAISHDIGKIRLPEEVINKPGALNEEEMALVKQHPEMGYRLLRILRVDPVASEIALQHHERLDGSGYPFGKKGGDISPLARIIAVADVVDTIISPQVYKPALSVEKAIREIKENGGVLYDPEVVAAVLTVIKKNGSRPQNS